jgi:serine/threonine protein kinase
VNKNTNKTDSAPSKAAQNADRRLSGFFNETDEHSSGPIYDELSHTSTRYSNFHKIASGGMKDIFSVDDNHGDRKLAIAKLHEDSGSENYETFLREARLTARLDHPNIIKIHDIGLNEENAPYFTMDLKSGSTLAVALQESLSLHELLVVFLKICDAISYAHSQGVIHLDLKPDNIQIGEYGEVLVCDWGLGKIIDDNKFSDDNTTGSYVLNDVTLHGHIKGTPGFMAPEQIEGNPKTATTDIFSLGALLYNILSKQKPYSGSVDEILKHTTCSAPQLPSKVSDRYIPQSLEAVVMKAMAISPGERYQTVQELSQEIRSYLSGFATKAENAGALKTLNLLIKRNKALFTVIVFFLCTIVIAGFIFINKIQQEKKTALEERDRANLLSQSELASRQKAEKSAQLLKDEKEELKELNKTYAEDLTLQSVFFSENINHWDIYDEKIYLKALENLNKATVLGPRNKLAWSHKTILLFVMQRYDSAYGAYSKAKNISFLEPILLKAKELVNDGTISAENLSSLIQMVNKSHSDRRQRKSLIDKMTTYDQIKNTRDEREKVIITKALIKVWNSGWQGEMVYEVKTKHLTLSGTALRSLRTTLNKLTIKHSILRLLKPVSLTLKETSLSDLFHIQDLKLKYLDIRGSKIKSIKGLDQFQQLSTLIIRPNQFKKKASKIIPPGIKIIYQDSE